MATPDEMLSVVELQRLAMVISAQGSFQIHTCYWGHTDEFKIWANDAAGQRLIIGGWGHHDHTYYLGRNESGIPQCVDDLSARFLITDSDGVPV